MKPLFLRDKFNFVFNGKLVKGNYVAALSKLNSYAVGNDLGDIRHITKIYRTNRNRTVANRDARLIGRLLEVAPALFKTPKALEIALIYRSKSYEAL